MPTKVVSYSELDSIRQCQLKAHLAYRERWKPAADAVPLSRGKLFHQVLEAHYRKIQSTQTPELRSGPSLARQTSVDEFLDPASILQESNLPQDEVDLVRWIYEGYLDHYGIDPYWKIVGVEVRAEAWLKNRAGNRTSFKLKGTADLVVEDSSMGGGLWIVDHKTCRELPKRRQLDLDDQMGIYSWLFKQQGLDIRGVIYNACRSYKLKRPMEMKERFARPLTVRTDKELEVMTVEALETFQDAYKRSTPSNTQEGVLPPRSPDPDRCGWRCPFTEACLMSRKGRDIRTLLPDFEFVQDPTRH